MNKFISLAVFALLISSCKSTEVAPGSERVRVLDAEPKGCLYVGEVSSVQEEKNVGTLETQMNLETRIDLRNKAHALGGNILVFLKGKNTNTLPGTTGAPLALKAGAKPAAGATAPVETKKEEPKESEDEITTIVFLGTVFKCPSSILNQ